MTAIKIVVEMYEIVLFNPFTGFFLVFFFGNYSGEVVSSSTYLNIMLHCLNLYIFPFNLTSRIITFTKTLFAWFSSTTHRFWFVFRNEYSHGIDGHFSRLSRWSIHIFQAGWIFFMLVFIVAGATVARAGCGFIAVWHCSRCTG